MVEEYEYKMIHLKLYISKNIILIILWNIKHKGVAPKQGRAVVQAVSRWLPTAMVWVQALSRHVGFLVDKAALGDFYQLTHLM
jgi:molybdate-binding protein